MANSLYLAERYKEEVLYYLNYITNYATLEDERYRQYLIKAYAANEISAVRSVVVSLPDTSFSGIVAFKNVLLYGVGAEALPGVPDIKVYFQKLAKELQAEYTQSDPLLSLVAGGVSFEEAKTILKVCI